MQHSFPVDVFTVAEVVRDGCRVLVLTGELDMTDVSRLDGALDARIDGLPVIVDLTSLAFVDSTGLHALLRVRDAGRPAALVAAPASSVGRVLDLVGARKTVPVYADVAAAIEAQISTTRPS